MKKSKPEAIKLPYASTVASYSQDQGASIGNSFLGSLFKKGAIGQPKPVTTSTPGAGMLK
jgi:hypothetical protein